MTSKEALEYLTSKVFTGGNSILEIEAEECKTIILKDLERLEKLDQYNIITAPKPILDKVEKEYLSAVIKPFRHRVRYISKNKLSSYEYISVYLKGIKNEFECIDFPLFEKSSMYRGMNLDKNYTLEELGL